ncbi:hypothetical protein ABPG72_010252 [Tetrahymena utriculariae]
MSGSEDSIENQSSFDDDSYSDGRLPRSSKRKGRKPKSQAIKDEDGADGELNEERDARKRQTRQKVTNGIKSLLEQERDVDQQILEAEQEEAAAAAQAMENDENAGSEPGGIFYPEIDQILWKRLKKGSESEYEYLIKYKEYSYLHCEWLEEKDVIGDSKSGKNKLNRFNKNFEKKLRDGDFDEDAEENERYFDPTYIEVDRILQCVELFPIIHPKKANEVKGKWSELLVVILQKLLNFTKDDVHYGIYFMEPVNPERDNCQNYKKIITNPMDLGTISNRLYLDYYKSFQHFFQDFGLIFKNCRKYNKDPESDIRILCDTLREAGIILYDEWFQIQKKIYELLIKDFNQMNDPEYIKKKEEEKKIEVQKQAQKRKKTFQKQTINLTKKLIEIQQKIKKAEEDELEEKNKNEQEEKDQVDKMEVEGKEGIQASDKKVRKPRFSLADEMKLFSAEHQEEISNNLTLKDIDMKEEHEIKNVINIFIQANKFLLDVEFSDEEDEKQENDDNKVKSSCVGDENDENQLSEEQKAEKRKKIREEAVAKYIDTMFQSIKNRRKKGSVVDLTLEEIEKYNPGKYNYNWLADEGLNSASVEEELSVYISAEEADALSLSVEIDTLYLVKWKNLSYLESTWEHESIIGNQTKINDYRMYNRALDKESRQVLSQQLERHKTLLDLEQNPKKKQKIGPQGLIELKNKLFFYDVANYKQPFQYTQKTQPIYKQRKLLRYYQLESLNWMIDAWYSKRNVILADEMGLGKTIQSTAFINHLYTFENVRGPFLVIAPLSTLEHWKRSVEDWTNLNAVLYYDHSGQEGRNCCRFYEWLYTDISTKGTVLQSNEIYKFQVLITSNEVFLSDTNNFLINIPFQFIVVDEAHRLKNQNAKILATLKRLPCKRTLLLTGTPIQNNTEELWTLLNYIEPNKFASLQEFKEQFGELQNKEQVDNLQVKIKPFLLRRMKEDVEDSIPPLQETIIDIEMTTLQKTLYRAIYERNKSMLQKNFSSMAMNTSLNNLEMQLRKCCNHPFLIKEMEIELTQNFKTTEERLKCLIDTSGKMILLDKLVMKYKIEGKKILVFSQFVYMLNLLEEYLRYRQLKYEKIDGSVKSKERQNAIDRFNDPDKKRDVFLLSTKAGGLGINLTSANIVIIFDSDWNPQNDVQATARAHRIGQKQEVMVYRFITKKTYEAEMFERATKKLGLDQAIFMGGEFKSVQGNKDESKKLGKNDVESLLKKGILGLVNEEEENKKSNEFQEEDIDQILKNNTRIAKYSVINGSYSFSKGSFISNKADTDLKIDDPNFWNKVLKDQESKTLLALKEYDERYKILSVDVEEQKKYFFKVCEFVNDLISSKLSLIGYNADDEKNITDILNKISDSKDFHTKYKDLAMNFIYEVSRPSRRFRKVTLQDLDVTNPENQKSKKNISNSSDENDLFYDGYSDLESDELGVGSVNNFPSEKKTGSKDKEKSTENGGSGVSKKEDLFKKLCYYCDRPKCTVFCQGHCKRSFHSECKERVEAGWINENGMTSETRIVPTEDHYDEERLKKILNINYTCKDCETNTAICFICKKKGSFFPPAVLNKQNKRIQQQKQKVIAEKEKQKDPSNDIVEESENEADEDYDLVDDDPVSQKTSDLTKCSTANCNKFYHPVCIKPYALFKYIDSNNKRFRCPLHYCAHCFVSGDSMAISQCVRCPKAYHLRCFEKAKVLKLTKKLMLCEDHPHQYYKNIHTSSSSNSNNKNSSSQNNNSRQQSSQNASTSNTNTRSKSGATNSNDNIIEDAQQKKQKLNNGTGLASGNNKTSSNNSSQQNGVNQAKEALEKATQPAANSNQSQASAAGREGRMTRSQEKSIQNQQSTISQFFGKKDSKLKEKQDQKNLKLEDQVNQEGDDLNNSQNNENQENGEQEQPVAPKPKAKKPAPPPPPPPKEREPPQFSYEDFNIPSQKDFDYKKYQRDWCRYCGARFSSNFTKGPWGPRTLCTVHYIAWNQKKKLDLRAYKELPTKPINPDDQTELHFMSRLKQKDESYNPEILLKEMMNTNLNGLPSLNSQELKDTNQDSNSGKASSSEKQETKKETPASNTNKNETQTEEEDGQKINKV